MGAGGCVPARRRATCFAPDHSRRLGAASCHARTDNYKYLDVRLDANEGTTHKFWYPWRRPRPAISVAALGVISVLWAIVMGAGSAAAATGQPVFTSAPTATFQTEGNNAYIVAASCDPACAFTAFGDLPPDVQIDPGGLLWGSPPPGTEGVYDFTITASNSVGTATQAFTLNMTQLAAIGVEGTDGQLWVQAPQLGPGWHSLGGKIKAPPAVVAPPVTCCTAGSPPMAPLFVATGTTKNLYIRSVTAGWEELGPVAASCIGAPAASITGTAPSGPFTLTVACRGLNNALWEDSASLPSSGLPVFTSSWKDLGGVLTAGPAVAPVNGTITFFALGTTGRIYIRTLSSGYSETDWSCLGQPNASAWPVGGETVNGVPVLNTSFVCQGDDHEFWESNAGGATWSPIGPLGGSLVGDPAIATAGSALEPVAEGTDHAIWVRTLSSSWVSLGGQAVGGVGAAALN